MLKEILAVSGKPGLFKLVSRAKNMLIVESMTDGKRIPAYARDKVISLGDVTVYTTEGDMPVSEILTKIKEKENGGKISLDISKAQPNEVRAYFAEIVPDFDRDKVYPTDIKKLLKWYEILITNGITDFSKKEEEEEEQSEETATDTTGDTAAAAASSKDDSTVAKSAVANAAKLKTTASTKRKDASLTAVKSAASVAAKSSSKAKTSTPKKSVVGAKRGG
jgi:hypothetical protein